jgi:hypothetical protein
LGREFKKKSLKRVWRGNFGKRSWEKKPAKENGKRGKKLEKELRKRD